jgi:pimeloyl-ACP methyl ester carboxylesterase
MVSTITTSQSVRSVDGTLIAFDRVGDGPPLILIEAAAHDRDFSSFDDLVPLLAEDFTVYTYDRRGRGERADTAPYSPDREVEDLEALIAAAGGAAHVYGYSSGALLAMHAAAQGLPIGRLALLEPPLQDAPDPSGAEMAHTLVSDCVLSDATTFAVLRSVAVPTLVLDSTDDLSGWAQTVAGELPDGSHRRLTGEWHGVPDETLAAALREFFLPMYAR